MTLGIAGLVAAYVLLAILLLSVNLYSTWSWQVKVVAVVVTSLFYLVSYFSFPPLLGWPTAQALPERFRLIAAEAYQPDKKTGEEGAVYLWAKKIKDLTAHTTPRAYVLPYSNPLHEKIINAQIKIKRGIPQLGEYEKGIMMIPTNFSSKETGQQSLDIQFYDLPDPLFPEK